MPPTVAAMHYCVHKLLTTTDWLSASSRMLWNSIWCTIDQVIPCQAVWRTTWSGVLQARRCGVAVARTTAIAIEWWLTLSDSWDYSHRCCLYVWGVRRCHESGVFIVESEREKVVRGGEWGARWKWRWRSGNSCGEWFGIDIWLMDPEFLVCREFDSVVGSWTPWLDWVEILLFSRVRCAAWVAHVMSGLRLMWILIFQVFLLDVRSAITCRVVI